jgi:hypothetical protein
VGSIDPSSLSFVGGLRTRNLHVSGVPANAEIIAAFLYWETIWRGQE